MARQVRPVDGHDGSEPGAGVLTESTSLVRVSPTLRSIALGASGVGDDSVPRTKRRCLWELSDELV